MHLSFDRCDPRVHAIKMCIVRTSSFTPCAEQPSGGQGPASARGSARHKGTARGLRDESPEPLWHDAILVADPIDDDSDVANETEHHQQCGQPKRPKRRGIDVCALVAIMAVPSLNTTAPFSNRR
jgi:hypothetical protein